MVAAGKGRAKRTISPSKPLYDMPVDMGFLLVDYTGRHVITRAPTRVLLSKWP